MTILFLHGLESGTTGRKARYLQEKYPAQVCIPDLHMSLWRPDRTNGVFRSAMRIAYARPYLLMTNWRQLLQQSVLESLARCADSAVNELRGAVDQSHRLVIGSSWGGAVALHLLARGDWKGPALLIAPALKKALLMCGSNNDDPARQQIAAWYKGINQNLAGADENRKIIVVHGDSDDTVPLADSKELCEAINAELIVVPAGTHRLNDYLLQQNKFQELVDRLLNQLPSR